MTLIEAVGSVLSQYAGFRGRARRSEFWWWQVFALLLGLVVGIAEIALGLGAEGGGPISTLVGLALIAPNVAVCVRRLHDTSRTGWWLLVALVPFVGFVVLLWFFVADSTPGTNQHGNSPKAPADTGDLEPFPPVGPGTDPAAADRAAPPSAAGTADAEPAQDPDWVPPGWDLPSPDAPGPDAPTSRPTASDSDQDTRPDRP